MLGLTSLFTTLGPSPCEAQTAAPTARTVTAETEGTTPESNEWDTYPWLVEGQLTAWGGPLGSLGIALEYSPTPWLGVNVGAGLGLTNDPQDQVSSQFGANLIVRPLSGTHGNRALALFVSIGPSIGRFTIANLDMFTIDNTEETETRDEFDRAYWLNVSVGLEVRSQQGVSFKAFAGNEALLNPNGDTCYPVYRTGPDSGRRAGNNIPCPSRSAYNLPFLGLSMGYAF